MKNNGRSTYIETVEAYFRALDARRVDDVLGYFNEDAVFTVQSAFVTCKGRDREIKTMFEQYFYHRKTKGDKRPDKRFAKAPTNQKAMCLNDFVRKLKDALNHSIDFLTTRTRIKARTCICTRGV